MIPKSFMLGGTRWRVMETKDISELGHCDRDSAVIRIRAGLPKQVKEATFCHELIHAIKFTRGETQHDEAEVDSIGNLLHQFFVTRK